MPGLPSLPGPNAVPLGPNILLALSYVQIERLLSSENGPVGKNLLKIVGKIERKAKRFAPVDTGRLQSSITHAIGTEDGNLVGVVGTNVKYAPHVEFGTSRMQAQSYLRRGLEEVEREA